MSAVERFTPLDGRDEVFRLAVEGQKVFLPYGAALPLPEWFQPTKEDEAEGVVRGRVPGLSVWNCARTGTADAARIRWGEAVPDGVRAFAIGVDRVREIGEREGRRLDVVADPLDPSDGEGADGHALIEGLKRPDGTPRAAHRQLLTVLVAGCRPLP